MNAARVRLRIDRLVLRGIPREQGDALLHALHEELARALAEPELLGAVHRPGTPSTRALTFRPTAGRTAGELGREAARALTQSISNGGRRCES